MEELIINTAVIGVVSAIVWLVTRGVWQELENQKTTISDLKDRRVSEIENRLNGAADSRKAMHRDLSDRVRVVDCKADRESMKQMFAGYNDSVLKLERVSERTDAALRRSELVMNQVIDLKGDLSELTGRISNMNGGGNG